LNNFETQSRFTHSISAANTPTNGVIAAVIFSLSLALSGCGKPAKTVEVATAPPPAAESPLAKEATRGDLAKIKVLIEEGADVNATDALGRTPLHMAAFFARPKTAALLITNGANVNTKDRVGLTPLHSAVLAGSPKVIELLLNKKADIKAASETGLTPLHLAAATGNLQVVTLLVQRGADPQSKDGEGNTPFALAKKNNHPQTATLLQQQVTEK
jgi:ankyrin repeat protein